MKVICKSNNFIAIRTKDKAKCLYELGQYLNKETCEVEMSSEQLKSIKCTKRPDDSKWSTTIVLEADLSYNDRYIILDEEGNLINVVTPEQFEAQYAVLKEEN